MINFRQYVNMVNCTIPNSINLRTTTDFSNAFTNMQNLKNVDFNHDNVTNTYMTYDGCTNLTGNPVCGNNVTDMYSTYWGCNLTGSPVCGPNVTNMSATYGDCRNLTGSPACGPNVINMNDTYRNCTNLTGSPVCGNNVTSMSWTYCDCYNLTGSPACGKNITSMSRAYYNCRNLHGNAYFYSPNISDVYGCFYKRNTSNRLNIYVTKDSTSLTTLLANTSSSMYMSFITWTNDLATNGYYYNASYNTYVYPVTNVEAARLANNDPDNMGNI